MFYLFPLFALEPKVFLSGSEGNSDSAEGTFNGDLGNSTSRDSLVSTPANGCANYFSDIDLGSRKISPLSLVADVNLKDFSIVNGAMIKGR